MENTSSCLIVVGLFVLSIIIALIVYLGGGWIVYDIYVSISPIKGSMTIMDIELQRILIYNCLASAYILLVLLFTDIDKPILPIIMIGTPIALYLMTLIIPISLGLVILNFVVCIIDIAIATFIKTLGYID